MTNKLSLLDKVKKIHVPEPGTGEIVILPSVEALCTWMKLNGLQFKQWRGSLLVVTAAADEGKNNNELMEA